LGWRFSKEWYFSNSMVLNAYKAVLTYIGIVLLVN
jgi:hypothetical protein